MMYDGNGWMWGSGNGWGGGGWILMTIVMVVFWAAVITSVVLLIRYLATERHGSIENRASSASTRAEDVLAERFARGEIDDEEFRSRVTLLREHR